MPSLISVSTNQLMLQEMIEVREVHGNQSGNNEILTTGQVYTLPLSLNFEKEKALVSFRAS